jgi:pimeloyl-ACP methyl ester carboxylesterase
MHLVVLTAAALLSLPRTVPEPHALPPAPALAAASTAPDRITVETEDKVKLVASYWAPKGKQDVPAALLVHATGGQRGDLDDYAEKLHKLGFAVLSIDLRGHGESKTAELDWAQLDEEGRKGVWALATKDVKAGADFLREQKGVHSAALVAVGHASGASLVARHAVRDENVRAVALLAPPSQPEQMYGFHLAKDLENLGGLPTYITVTKDGRDEVQRMADNGQRANGGLGFIEISVFKGESPQLLTDAREATEVARWLKEKSFPSKGSR